MRLLRRLRLAVCVLLLCPFTFIHTQTVPEAPQPSTSAATAPAPNFFIRWAHFYRDNWSGKSLSGPAPQKRGAASPLDSPPFPSSDWSYGGSQDIGAPDGNTYPLMTAIDGARGRTKIYGWIDPSVNYSTSGHTNQPQGYDRIPNRIELQQSFIFVERLADTVQTKHFDVGYHFTFLYGTDFDYTVGKGYFSKQLIKYNRQYGYDLPMEYVDLYFPHVAQGMDLRIGRYTSIPGIETQLATTNYVFSHSLLGIYDPFTDTGTLATIKLSDRWLVQTGMTVGHDIAPWAAGIKPTGYLCLNYTTPSVKDNFDLCANGVNDGKYAYDNVQMFDGTWYHKFSKSWHIATEAWYMYERDVPNVSPMVTHPITPEPGTYGALCFTVAPRCTAPEYAWQNYIQKSFSPSFYLSFRSELMDDKKGQRTSFATKYTENTFAAVKWFGNTVLLRPELRFDRSWDRPAYNGGRSSNQFTLATDLIYRF